MMSIQKTKKENGMVTVETAVFLVIFLGAYLAILAFGRLAYAEIVMQQALDATAMQISQYSYVLTKMGAVKAINETSAEAAQTKSDISTVTQGVTDIYSAFSSVTDGDITEDDVNTVLGAAESGKTAYNVASSYFKNPKGLLTGLLAVGKEGLEEEGLRRLTGWIAKGQIESYLESVTSDPDAYLKKLGVVDGLDGIDYDRCSLIADQTQDVVVTVEFYVENPVSIFGIQKRKVRLSASTRVW
jgi:hypothetical protein